MYVFCLISRLCPLAGGNGRFIQEDVVLSGYKVPAGVCAISIMAMDGVQIVAIELP